MDANVADTPDLPLSLLLRTPNEAGAASGKHPSSAHLLRIRLPRRSEAPAGQGRDER
jgi:hypothetical protein